MSDREPSERSSAGVVIPRGDLALATLVNVLADAVADRLVARLSPANERLPNGDDLLSYEQVAEMLTATTPVPAADVQRPAADYIRQLVKRGALPAVRLGKYVRVQRRDVHALIAQRRDPGIDSRVYHWYTSGRDRRRAAEHSPSEAAHHSSRARRSTRDDRHDSRAVGTGRASHRGDGSALHPAADGPRDGQPPSSQ